jgi:SET domain-containing protein
MGAERRKFYQDELSKYFLVEYLKESIIDPAILPLLNNHDITQDPQFSDKNLNRRLELHTHYFEHGFSNDRRIYVALCSQEMGYGAFAEVYIPAWTVIGEYTGIITSNQANTDYAWSYYSKPKDSQGNELLLRTDGRTRGNITRFVNHSDYPNCSVIHVPYKNRWRTLYIANSNIMPDQELTVYYGEIYWKDRNKKEE